MKKYLSNKVKLYFTRELQLDHYHSRSPTPLVKILHLVFTRWIFFDLTLKQKCPLYKIYLIDSIKVCEHDNIWQTGILHYCNTNILDRDRDNLYAIIIIVNFKWLFRSLRLRKLFLHISKFPYIINFINNVTLQNSW